MAQAAAIGPGPQPGLIGPNAILRVAESLRASGASAECEAVFRRAALDAYLDDPPAAMVPEDEVRRLHRALRDELGVRRAAEVAMDAGRRTGDYLLAHRIPRPVQVLLKSLPPDWSARLLLRAIGRHAWTFAGSGSFTASAGRPVILRIEHNPMCAGLQADEPSCFFYAATFERLFAELVHRRSKVVETACEAAGAAGCRFELRWDDAAAQQTAAHVRARG